MCGVESREWRVGEGEGEGEGEGLWVENEVMVQKTVGKPA